MKTAVGKRVRNFVNALATVLVVVVFGAGPVMAGQVSTGKKTVETPDTKALLDRVQRSKGYRMAEEKPAISFDVDGAREVINENTGRLVEPKNTKQLIAACAELIQDKELREKLGSQGRESVKAKPYP